MHFSSASLQNWWQREQLFDKSWPFDVLLLISDSFIEINKNQQITIEHEKTMDVVGL